MIFGFVRKGLIFSADYQYFDEINVGLPRYERTYGPKSSYYQHFYVEMYKCGVGTDFYP